MDDPKKTGEQTKEREEGQQTNDEKIEQQLKQEAKAQEERKPAGGDSAPSKKEESQERQPDEKSEEKTEPSKIDKDRAQQRIDKMYARLQSERRKRMEAENRNKAQQFIQKREEGEESEDEDEEEDGKRQVPQGMTPAQLDQWYERKEREKEMINVEKDVLMRHPEALDDDGNFNLNDPFCRKYIEIGKKNPQLAGLVDGPKLAEAMAEKELGLDYKKGRYDEAGTRKAMHDAQTFSSTTRPQKATGGNLTDSEKKVAANMGLTEDEYIKHKKASGR